MLPPFSGSRNKPSKKPAFLLGLFFNPEYGGDIFFLNVDTFSADYTSLYPRSEDSSLYEMVQF
jgi:hypothetical protein